MATFWDWLTGNAGTGGGMSSVSGVFRPGPTSMASARGTYRPGPTTMANARGKYKAGSSSSTKYVAPSTGAGSDAINAAYDKQMRDLQALGGRQNLQSQIAQELAGQSAAQSPLYMGMTPEELTAYLLGGGGGPDLSGFQGLIDDVNARRDALNIRKWQQRQFLTDLFDAAEARATADKAGIATSVEAQLKADAKRRADEIALIQGEEEARREVADAARGALGVTPGEDLSTAVSENVAGGVGAMGSVADRDARIRQSIAEQQLAREIAGLAPLEAMSVGDLMSQYEDRLAALASERASIKAQMAQARAASRGPSASEKMNALQFVQGVFNPQSGVEVPGIAQTAQGIQALGPQANDILGIANRILTSAGTDVTGKPLSTQQILTNLRNSDPAVASFLQSYPMAAGLIVNYVEQALKG